MRLVSVGAVAGIVGAIPLALLLRSAVQGVRPLDPLTFVAVPALLAAVALSAMWMPTRRASRIEPAQALRYE